jgi:hypothetical protein
MIEGEVSAQYKNKAGRIVKGKKSYQQTLQRFSTHDRLVWFPWSLEQSARTRPPKPKRKEKADSDSQLKQ